MFLQDLKKKIKSFDWTFFILIFLLVILGLVIQYSLSLGLEPNTFSIFKKHIIFICLGFILFFLLSFFDFQIIKPLVPFLYFLVILLLLFVFVFGTTLRGVRGWYSLGVVYFQPAELAKLIFVITLAKIWAGKIKETSEAKRFFLSTGLLLPLVFLSFLQPDFGSALIFILIWLFIISLNIRNFKYLISILIIFVLTSFIFWNFVLHDYHKARIINFFSPGKDPLGWGYQILQSKIAIGAGRIFGRGIGYGSQGQMRFLPASRSDFIFAVFSEELGFFGSSFLILLFTLLFLKIIRISKTIDDPFSFFLVLGLGFNLFIHVIINIGMNLGLLPIIGIPLPLISYGGSFLITTFVSLGIIESTIIHQKITLY